MPATDGDALVNAGSPRKQQAIELFRGLGERYDRLSAALSFWQDPRWRRALVDAVAPAAGARILDVATGTGMVAGELLARDADCTVVGLDQSAEMLARARARFDAGPEAGRVELVEGEAERLPFADASSTRSRSPICCATWTTRRRPCASSRGSLKPGGRIASLEFGVPSRPVPHLAWRFYTAVGLPTLGRLFSREWYEVGRFLGPSIAGFYVHHPLPAIVGYWQAAGIKDVRVRRMSLGGGVVMSAGRADARAD